MSPTLGLIVESLLFLFFFNGALHHLNLTGLECNSKLPFSLSLKGQSVGAPGDSKSYTGSQAGTPMVWCSFLKSYQGWFAVIIRCRLIRLCRSHLFSISFRCFYFGPNVHQQGLQNKSYKVGGVFGLGPQTRAFLRSQLAARSH